MCHLKMLMEVKHYIELYSNVKSDVFLLLITLCVARSKLWLWSDVDLEMFLRFNKIRALVDNTTLLGKALSKSETLQVVSHCSFTLNWQKCQLNRSNWIFILHFCTVFSERGLMFTFAICCRPSVCRLSVCRL